MRGIWQPSPHLRTNVERRVAQAALEHARLHFGEWFQFPLGFEVRSSFHSAQRRILSKIRDTGRLSSSTGLCVCMLRGCKLTGLFEVCQPNCDYRGSTAHAKAFEALIGAT
jgi:hypothetical protein